MIIIPSDSLILDDNAFRALAEDALSLAGREAALITIGIKPTWACPSYGYIERAGKLEDAALTHNCYEVVRFREKPDAATAAEYLASGNFSWNAGMFIWNVAHVRSQLATHSPELAGFIDRLTAATDLPGFITTEFPQLTPISIDFALLEKADRVLNFEATFDWDDVGSYPALLRHLPCDANHNRIQGDARFTQATGCTVLTTIPNHTVIVAHTTDLFVAQTPSTTVICPASEANRIAQWMPSEPPTPQTGEMNA
jgi:mannose-1-phosphate guanylyltransferase